MGKPQSPPSPAPDYEETARLQGKANLESARVGARLSNPNIISPYGSQTVQYGAPTFDQSGFDKATAAYNSNPSGYSAPTFDQSGYDNAMQTYQSSASSGGAGQLVGDATGDMVRSDGKPLTAADYMSMGYSQSQAQQLAPNAAGSAPTRDQFTTAGVGTQGQAPTRDQFMVPGSPDTPTVTQTLNPESQQIFNTQQQTKLGLSNLANQGISSVQGTLGTPFRYQGPGVQTSVPGGGDISQGPSAGQYGSAGGISGNQYGNASGVSGNQYGNASGVSGNQYGSATQNLNLSDVARMPVNAGMTGQNALMARLQPQIDRERQQYETQLRNQGLVAGGEAYGNAMTIQGQRENDLKSQAALYGINLDLGANQQGYNQALQSGQFGNQAIGQNFAQGLAGQQQQNQAIGQNFGQGLAGQQQQNQAIAQNFGQGVTGQQLTNQAIGQNYNQGMQSAAFGNNAQNQRYNQGLQSAQFGNTAQQQDLQQQLYMRNLPLNEISALTSGSQIQNTQFMQYQGQNVAAPNYQNAAAQQYNARLQGYGMQNNSDNAMLTGLMGIGGSLLGGPAGSAGATLMNRFLR